MQQNFSFAAAGGLCSCWIVPNKKLNQVTDAYFYNNYFFAVKYYSGSASFSLSKFWVIVSNAADCSRFK